MRIALGADHRAADETRRLAARLAQEGHEVVAEAICRTTSCDYPDQAREVADAVASGSADRGILACGSGIGVSIAANKVNGIRAALVRDEHDAEMSRRHNDANVLCVSSSFLASGDANAIIARWLATEFDGGRHVRRVDKITQLEDRARSAPANPRATSTSGLTP